MTDPYVAFSRRRTDPGPTPLDLMRLIDGRGAAGNFASWNGNWSAYASWLYHLCLRRRLVLQEVTRVVARVLRRLRVIGTTATA